MDNTEFRMSGMRDEGGQEIIELERFLVICVNMENIVVRLTEGN